MRLTDEMKEMVERLRLCYVATVRPDGKPNLSPKGSLPPPTMRLSCLLILPPPAPCAICAAIPSLKSIWLITTVVRRPLVSGYRRRSFRYHHDHHLGDSNLPQARARPSVTLREQFSLAI